MYRLPKQKSAFFSYAPKSFDCTFIEIIIMRKGREGRKEDLTSLCQRCRTQGGR